MSSECRPCYFPLFYAHGHGRTRKSRDGRRGCYARPFFSKTAPAFANPNTNPNTNPNPNPGTRGRCYCKKNTRGRSIRRATVPVHLLSCIYNAGSGLGVSDWRNMQAAIVDIVDRGPSFRGRCEQVQVHHSSRILRRPHQPSLSWGQWRRRGVKAPAGRHHRRHSTG